jgi:hypothetical protein
VVHRRHGRDPRRRVARRDLLDLDARPVPLRGAPLRSGGGDRREPGFSRSFPGDPRSAPPFEGDRAHGWRRRGRRRPHLGGAAGARRRDGRIRARGTDGRPAGQRRLHPDLHLGHHGSAEGGHPLAHQPAVDRASNQGGIRVHRRRPASELPAAQPHRRADRHPARPDAGRRL